MGSQPAVSTASDALHLSGVLIRLVRALDQRFRALAGRSALTLPELGVLGQIDRGVDAPSQIARALRLDPARVTHLVDRLVTLDHIARAVDQRDRRRTTLRPTALGMARLEKGRADARAAMTSLLEGLTEEERNGLVRGLDGVHRVLAAMADSEAPSGAQRPHPRR